MTEAYVQPANINIKKSNFGKIRIKSYDTARLYVKLTLISLIILTVYAFLSFDYKGIDFLKATSETLNNIGSMFINAGLIHFSYIDAVKQISVTLSLAFLTTLTGSIIAFFLSLFAAKNLSNSKMAGIIKSFVAFIRAVPTVLWVLIFAVTVGLGSEAAVIGMIFHTIGYLIKSYSEAFEELDEGIIEALKASGANFWQIVFQGVFPSSISYLMVWTFMRFEINFTNAVAMGAAAGAGGIGFELFMASSFYYNVQEVGFIALSIFGCALVLEIFSTRIKNKYLK